VDEIQRVQCEAKIREPLTPELRLRGYSFGNAPISDIQCSRSSTGEVCGVEVCSQHRDQLTTWVDGREVLRPRADKRLASWGLSRRGEFVPESDLLPLPAED
jgi:hypothetical protein